MAVFQNNLLAGAGAQSSGGTTYTIDQSIRFNRSDSPKLSRTPSSNGNRRTFTISFWYKLTDLGTRRVLFSADTSGSDYALFEINADNKAFFTHSSVGDIISTRVFRDTSAFYHFVLVVDTTNAVDTERVRLYVNGSRVTSFATETYPSKNFETNVNSTSYPMAVGSFNSLTSLCTGGYLAEIVFIDGTALDPTSFGETNDSGIWVPKDVSGLTFGTNGFHIDGRDASDLGDDESGNGNDFTASGLASHDQVLDSPTNNFCTINSVYADNAPAGNAGTLSNGNLQYVGGGSTFSVKGLTFDLPKSGKWYFEYMIGGTNDGFGFIKQGEQGSINASNGPGNVSVAQGGGIQYSGWRNGGNFTVNFGTTFTAGHIHQVAIDVDNGKFFYGIQNTYYAADAGTDGNPSAGTNETSTFAFSTTDVVLLAGNYSGTQYWNFGQDGTFSGQQTAQGNSDANGVGNFYYAVPTGYKSLCTKNVGS